MEKKVTITQKALLSLVAFKLKDRILFPESLKRVKEYLSKIKK